MQVICILGIMFTPLQTCMNGIFYEARSVATGIQRGHSRFHRTYLISHHTIRPYFKLVAIRIGQRVFVSAGHAQQTEGDHSHRSTSARTPSSIGAANRQ